MARKIKTPKVPLSRLDQFIYLMLSLLWGAFCIATELVFGIVIPEALAFSDASVIAKEGVAGIFCAMPMAFFGAAPLLIAMGHAWQIKQPIFGNKKFKPKFGKPVIKLTPLFSPEFRKNLQEDQKKYIKKILISFVITFTVCALIVPFGFFPRKVLDNENTFKTYNSFNHVTHEAALEEATCAVIRITRSSSGRRGGRRHWGITMKFVFEEKTYYVTLGSFGDMEREDVLRYMLSLKDYFKDGRYEILSTEWMDRLIDDKNFTATEQKLVYDLFDYTP